MLQTRRADPGAPDYAAGSIADVLPSVCASLGVPGAGRDVAFPFPETRSAVVVLVDGLGAEQLARRYGHAPWLRAHREHTRTITAGFPSTTATSMGSFGTGSVPGAHGLLGYEVLDPERDLVFNELSWEDGPVPERWQTRATWFERAAAAGIDVLRTGPGFFDGSGLTRASTRGGRFVAAESLAQRVDATLAALRTGRPTLVYLYWGEVDKVGHVFGPESIEWCLELESVDRELARLAGGLPAGTSLTLTADHGMLDCPQELRLDLADEPELLDGVRHVGREPRVSYLYCEPGAAPDVLARWSERLGDEAWVRTRADAVAAGWFGPVAHVNLARIGDVIVAQQGQGAVVDSERMRPELVALRGLHGSLTTEELAIPLVHVPGET